MAILSKLKRQELFTLNQQEVVDYILIHTNEISSMTIQDLAKATYSSNATIIRICKKVECDGFKDFKLKLTKEIENQKYIQNDVDFTKPFHSKENTVMLINHFTNLYKESIDIINSSLDIKNLEMIAKTIIKAKRIFIFAYGDTGLTVEGFINKLTKLNYFPILATKNREDGYLIQNISKEDCVLFMTYSGNKDFNQYSYLIKKRGCPILSITSNENSAVYTKSDYCILIPSKELENKISTFYSQLAFHYLLNLIYSLIYQGISR